MIIRCLITLCLVLDRLRIVQPLLQGMGREGGREGEKERRQKGEGRKGGNRVRKGEREVGNGHLSCPVQ